MKPRNARELAKIAGPDVTCGEYSWPYYDHYLVRFRKRGVEYTVTTEQAGDAAVALSTGIWPFEMIGGSNKWSAAATHYNESQVQSPRYAAFMIRRFPRSEFVREGAAAALLADGGRRRG